MPSENKCLLQLRELHQSCVGISWSWVSSVWLPVNQPCSTIAAIVAWLCLKGSKPCVCQEPVGWLDCLAVGFEASYG